MTDFSRFIGQVLSDELEADIIATAGVSSARVERPGEFHTTEYNPDRVRIRVDETNTITDVLIG